MNGRMRLAQAQTLDTPGGEPRSFQVGATGAYRFMATSTCLVGLGGRVAISGVPYTPGDPWELHLDAGTSVTVFSTAPLTAALVPVCT